MPSSAPSRFSSGGQRTWPTPAASWPTTWATTAVTGSTSTSSPAARPYLASPFSCRARRWWPSATRQITSEAVAQGASLAVVAAGYQINPECIMSLASKPIKTPADLIGKKIGVGSADEPEWQAFLKVNNIPDSKVDTVPAGFDPSPVASGEWDGYLAFANNEPPQFEAQGIKTQLLLFQDYGLPELNEIYIVTTDTLNNPQEHKKAAAFPAGEDSGMDKGGERPVPRRQGHRR
jgi:hypothetical protein